MTKPTFEERLNIKNKVDIVDIVRDYVPLVQKGKNYFGICPFHDDHNPSMSVSPERKMYKCFVCGAGGDVFNFVQNYEKISYNEAVQKVASKIGIDIKLDTNVKKVDDKYINQYEIYDISNKFYQNNLNTNLGKIARSYLKDRQITEEMIKHFQIGLSFSDNKLSKLLQSKGYDDNLLVKSGICVKTNNGIYDIYRDRIMFPLWDINGKTNGFSGRIYEGNDQSKYINTMETDIFKKGTLLYNYHNAREHVLKDNKIIIVEGFMDVIRLYSIGIYNVVATMGTAVTKEQVNLIRKITNNVILMFDGDAAGKKATDSFIEVSSSLDFNIKVVRLEENLDPDEYILNKGKDNMIYHLNNSKSIIDDKVINERSSIDLTNGKEVSKFIDNVIIDLSKIKDDIALEVEINKLSKLVNISPELIKARIKKVVQKEEKSDKIVSRQREIRETKYDKASKMILFNMLKHNNIILYYYNNLSYLPNDLDRKLASEIVLFYKKFNSFNVQDFITYLEDREELINRVIEIDELKYDENYSIEEIDNYIKTIKEYSYKKDIEELTKKLKNETNEVVRREIAKKIETIIKECK